MTLGVISSVQAMRVVCAPAVPALLRGLTLLLAAIGAGAAAADGPDAEARLVRICTYNVSLHRDDAGKLIEDLHQGSQQAADIAEVLKKVRPDIVLLNEVDYDSAGRAAELFHDRYLARAGKRGGRPLRLPHRVVLPVNTGAPSGRDLNKDGQYGGPADAIGFGKHHGQYGMLVLSRYPIDTTRMRTFQKLLWKSMPGALLPELDGRPYYSRDDLQVLRLSSKSHWDVPIRINQQSLHLLCSHPTPPVFDGEEDRNGRRNYDEIRFWADYVRGGAKAAYIVDDKGVAGGLGANSPFVIAGDLNADPVKGDSRDGAIQQLLGHELIQGTLTPRSSTHGPNTAEFGRGRGYRVDYLLPSLKLRIPASGVFWPADGPGSGLVQASDHRPVWIDIAW